MNLARASQMWSSNPVISIKLPQQLVGELRCSATCPAPRDLLVSEYILLFSISWQPGEIFPDKFPTLPNSPCLFIFTVWRWDVFWFSLDMTNDVKIPLRMTFDNLRDNISCCHSFIWHSARVTRLQTLLSGHWPPGPARCLNTNTHCPDRGYPSSD